MMNPAGAEASLGNFKAAPFAQDNIGFGDTHIFQMHLAVATG